MNLGKIDIHVHSILEKGIVRPGRGDSYATPEELLDIYERIGVEKGVLLPSGVSPEAKHYQVLSEEVYQIANKYPNKFYWFCNVDPRIGQNSPDTDLSYYIQYYKNLGARGVGEITANLYFDDPLVLNLFHHCQLCNMPVIFHIGNKGNDYGLIDEIGLPRLEKVLKMFPNLHFIGHSQKFWAEISLDVTLENRNGYPKGKVVPGGRLIELMRKYPNLSCDLSANSGYNALMRDVEFAYKFIEEFQDRLYYGTDIATPKAISSPMLKLSAWLDESVELGCISPTAYEKISRTNALKLLERDDK